MNTFVVSARKYRPKRFSDVVGQSHITQTLQNAIINQQIASAFLFNGLKGSGKTSSSRIFAKAINCDASKETGEPCGVCPSCKEKVSFHTHELDAASHNSAEDMRTIVDQIRYCAPNNKKTIIIIDEAHMLSTAALNVLLKPLEDTPSHVVFMLVTTEKQKIIPTIRSRCLPLNFRVIRVHEIQKHLAHVAAEEKIVADENALLLISQRATGSIRDALSMFDLITTFSGDKTLTYDATLRHLNLLDENVYIAITDALYAGHIGEALLQYDTIIRQGFDGYQFIGDLGKHLRNLLVAKKTKTSPLLQVNPAVEGLYATKAAELSTSFILKALGLVQACQMHYKASLHQRLHVEMLLMDIGQLEEKGAIARNKMQTLASLPQSAKATAPSSKGSQVYASVQPTEGNTLMGRATSSPPRQDIALQKSPTAANPIPQSSSLPEGQLAANATAASPSSPPQKSATATPTIPEMGVNSVPQVQPPANATAVSPSSPPQKNATATPTIPEMGVNSAPQVQPLANATAASPSSSPQKSATATPTIPEMGVNSGPQVQPPANATAAPPLSSPKTSPIGTSRIPTLDQAQAQVEANSLAEGQQPAKTTAAPPSSPPKKSAKATVRIPTIRQAQAQVEANSLAEGQETNSTASPPPMVLDRKHLMQACRIYADMMRKQRSFFPIEALQHPITLTGTQVVLTCYKSLSEVFEKSITTYLQGKFQQQTITVTHKLVPPPKATTKSYTDLEKLSSLCEKYPNVAYLKENLGLVVR